jgi:hypothetical protein
VSEPAWQPTLKHPGSFHRQSIWRERALDTKQPLPKWIRLALLAYAHHRANGHANFKAGELQKELNTNRRQLLRALADAVKYGWLDVRSNDRCLVVPQHAIYRGLGNHRDPCEIHDGKRTR